MSPTGRLRVLQVHTRYRETGGEDLVVQREAALLRAAGHVVEQHLVANPDRDFPAAAALAASPWNVRAAARLGRVIAEVRPDVVHVHNTWFALGPAALRSISAAGRPLLVTLHNYRLLCLNGLLLRDGGPCEDCVGRVPLRGVAHACYRKSRPQSAIVAGALTLHRRVGTWDRVDRYLALSEFGRSRFVAGGLPAERIVVKPNFVEDLGERPAPPSRGREVLFVGRLSPEKGAADLVAAWAAARPSGLKLVIVGEGSERDRLEKLASDGVSLVGRLPVEEVRARLRGARALVFPSRWYEGQSLVLLEALEAGLPVLGSDLGSTGEIVRSLDPAWAQTPGDVAAWSAGLARLEDEVEVDRIGALARRRYLERFTPGLALEALEAVYREVLAEQTRTGE